MCVCGVCVRMLGYLCHKQSRGWVSIPFLFGMCGYGFSCLSHLVYPALPRLSGPSMREGFIVVYKVTDKWISWNSLKALGQSSRGATNHVPQLPKAAPNSKIFIPKPPKNSHTYTFWFGFRRYGRHRARAHEWSPPLTRGHRGRWSPKGCWQRSEEGSQLVEQPGLEKAAVPKRTWGKYDQQSPPQTSRHVPSS